MNTATRTHAAEQVGGVTAARGPCTGGVHVGAGRSANGGGTASEAGGEVVRDDAGVNDVLLGRPRPSQHTGEVVDALFRHLAHSPGE